MLIVLMIVPENFDFETLMATGAPSSGGKISRMMWLSLISFSCLVMLLRARIVLLVMRVTNPFLWLFAALAVMSIAWSLDPAVTTRRVFRLFTMLFVCIAFVSTAWHRERFQRVLRFVITTMIVASLIFGVMFPEYAIHQDTAPELIGAWHGLANHKNGFGALCSTGLILWTHAALTHEVKTRNAVFACGAALLGLALSRSSTSMLAAVVVIAFLWAFLRAPSNMRPYQNVFVIALVALLLVYALALLNVIPGMSVLLAPISAVTDKDTSLTGRTEIWAILKEHIRLHPVLGAGYAAFWVPHPDTTMESYDFIAKMGGFYPGSGHNGYLEVANDMGLLGLACLLAYIVTYVRQALSLVSIDRNQAALYLAIFIEQIVANQSESHWFSVLSVDFVIMTLTTLALGRSLLEYRLRSAFGDPYRGGTDPIAAQALRGAAAPAVDQARGR
jgi:O-antigen ligase